MGEVRSVAERSFSSQATDKYAELYFRREKLTLIVRMEEAKESIRKLITPDEAQNLLEHMRTWKGKPKSQWKARADAHQRAIESGNPMECAEVLKGLNQMESDGTLRNQDRNHLKQSLELLIDELTRVLTKRPSQARKLIYEALES